MVLFGKSSQDQLILEFYRDPTLFLPHVNDLSDDVIGNIAIYTDDSAICTKCDQAFDLWQQP